jgi:hypothetical protein
LGSTARWTEVGAELDVALLLGEHNEPQVKLLVTTKTAKPDVQVERLVRRQADAASDRLLRGGAFNGNASLLLPPNRDFLIPTDRDKAIGFRCARTP